MVGVEHDNGNGVTTKKKRKKRTGVTCGPKWKSMEDECLIDAWKAVSFCPITGANQSAGKYYKLIYDQFSERKNFGDYAAIHMIRNESAMSHRWNIIKAACNKFHGCYEKVKNRKESGKTMVDWMFDALAKYKDENEDNDFIFMHCFKKLEGCKKWDNVRLTLNGKDGVGEDGPVIAAASTGRPIGNKKAKAERNGAPALATINASIEKMVSSFSIENKDREDRGAAMRKAILEK